LDNQLNRSLGLWTAVATVVGIVVASSTVVSLLQGFGIAGPGFIIAMFTALLLNLFIAFSFAELSSIIPKAGGINHYTLPTMGPFVGIISVLSGYVLVTMFAGSAEASIAGLVMRDVFLPSVNPTAIAVIFVVILGLINIRGIELYSWVQIIVTTLEIGSIFAIGIIALTGSGSGEPLPTSLSFNEMGWGVFGLTALAFWLFVGVEFVTPMVEELKKPKIYIPLSMFLGLVIILVSDLLFGFGAIKYVPLNTLAESDSPQVGVANAIMGRNGQIWIGLATLFATISTINTLIYAIPRMLYSMGKNGQMPQIFSRLNKWKTPWVGVVFIASLFLVFLLVGITDSTSIVTFIIAASFCWFITYIIAHLNVIIMRFKFPNVERSFKSPLGITFQVLGIIGLVYMMFNIFPDPVIAKQIYFYASVFLGITIVYSFIWVKFVMKKKLFQLTPLEELLAPSSEQIKTPKQEGPKK
jgi:amino acid transporter